MRVSDIKSEMLSAKNFETEFEILRKKVEKMFPGKTIKVIDFKESNLIFYTKIYYKLVDKINDPINELKEIANMLEKDNPDVSNRIRLIADQIESK